MNDPEELVVDASVGIKWFVPEDDSPEALRLLEGCVIHHVPSLFATEVTQAIWKKVHLRREIDIEEGQEAILDVMTFPVRIHSTHFILGSAFEIAASTGRTVYDRVYLALAESIGCRMVTADDRLYNALRGTAFEATMVRLADFARTLSTPEGDGLHGSDRHEPDGESHSWITSRASASRSWSRSSMRTWSCGIRSSGSERQGRW